MRPRGVLDSHSECRRRYGYLENVEFDVVLDNADAPINMQKESISNSADSNVFVDETGLR